MNELRIIYKCSRGQQTQPGRLRGGHTLVDHSSPPSANVKNKWRYTSTLPIYLHGMDRKLFPVS